MWLKTNEASDVISYKKVEGKKTIVIEARLENSKWKIYKTYHVNGINKLVKEYSAYSRNQAVGIIERLKVEKEITESRQIHPSSIKLNLHREYKEYDVEKWIFTVNSYAQQNVVIIRYADEIIIDLLLNEKFRAIEKIILAKLFSTLNLNEIGCLIKQNIYYFNDENHSQRETKKGVLVGKIEMDFSDSVDSVE